MSQLTIRQSDTSSDTLSNDENLEKLHRLAEIGRISSSLLHDISNPLAAALLHIELNSQKTPLSRQLKRDLQLMQRYIEAARQNILSQSQAGIFYIQPQLRELRSVVMPLAKQAGVKLNINPVPDCKLYGDAIKFQQIIANLIMNAIQAYDETTIHEQAMLVNVSLKSNNKWLIIEVTDWGKGIATEELPKLFEPFYTTKNQQSRSLGIGLAIVKQYVTIDFSGSLKVSSSGRGGTQFSVKLRTLSG